MKNTNLRDFVVFVYAIAFLLSITVIASIPAETWQHISSWQAASFAFYILVGFCGVLIAYWIRQDGNAIERLSDEALRNFQEKLDKMKEKSS